MKIDTSITGFHLVRDTLNKQNFSKAENYKSSFSFTLSVNEHYMDIKDELEQIVIVLKQSGYKITNVAEKDTVLNGYKAFYLSYFDGGNNDKYKEFVFNAFVINDNTLILFQSDDLDTSNGELIKKFNKTFFSIKM